MNWLSLSPEEQQDVLEAVAARQGRLPVILEKDLWVVWALDQVFRVDLGVPLAFKGGTSLSKAYAAIGRFSEDLDLTLGLLGEPGLTLPELTALSRNKRDRSIESLKQQAQDKVMTVMLPHLQAAAQTLDGRLSVDVEGDPAALQLNLRYPSVLQSGTTYIQRRVLLEFGGRNAVLPSQEMQIRTYLADDPQVAGAVQLPQATVQVLDARRTFWEKLTALHVACQQPEKLHRLVGFSRHLLDLHLLMQTAIGPAALTATDLRDEVIDLKTLLFREGAVQYADVREGKAVLIPTGAVLKALTEDYGRMEESGMFGTEHVTFATVLDTLAGLEHSLQQRPADPLVEEG